MEFSRKTKGVCPECNSVIEDVNDNFCSNCGWKISKFQAIKTKNDLKFKKKENEKSASREEAERETEKLKREIDEKKLVNFQLGNTDVSRKINEKLKEEIKESINDNIIEKYGTDEEIKELTERRKRKEQKKKEGKEFNEKYNKIREMGGKESISAFKQLMDETDDPDLISKCYDGMAWSYTLNWEYDKAIEVTKECIVYRKQYGMDCHYEEVRLKQINESAFNFHLNQLQKNGESLFYKFKYDEALINLKEAIELGSTKYQTFKCSAEIYIVKRDLDSAINYPKYWY